MAIKLGDALLYLGADDDKLKRDLNEAEGKTKGWGATMTGVMAGIGFGIAGAVTGVITGAMDTVMESIDLASDLAETTSKVNTLFGESAVAIEEWATSAAMNLGMTKQAALDAVGGIGNVFLQLGADSETAADTSQKLVQLATDLGSFHNADPTEVLDSISGALRGEYDSLQKYVPMVSAAAVEQRALRDSGKEAASELTALDRATALVALTMEGSGAAVGDFARTSDGWANTMKTLNAYWEEFKTLLGETLLPVLTPILEKVKELANQYLPMLADYIHEHVIPAIEEWAAKFDDWWADHGEPFLKDAQKLWDDFVSKVDLAMGDTDTEFGANMETLKATARVVGAEIGDALGQAIGGGLQKWWDESFDSWWDFHFGSGLRERWNAQFNGLVGMTPQAAPALSGGGGGGGGFRIQSIGAQSIAPAVTIINNVDAQSRSVGEAARDGTLEGLRQAGMR
jgi:hypothetical protein